MDYENIEKLVKDARLGNKKAKEKLAEEFTPFILKLSKKTFINSYEFADIQNECYKTLFKCVNVYNPEKHRFVAYAIKAIRNSVNLLIRTSITRSGAEGSVAFILDGKLENTLYFSLEDVDDAILREEQETKLKVALKKLDYSELELITYLYFKEYPLKKYAELKGINYSAAFRKKVSALDKLRRLVPGS